MAAERQYWDESNITPGKTSKDLAEKIKGILTRYNIECYFADSANGMVIERYQHRVSLLEGTIELLYRPDGKPIETDETSYKSVGANVQEEHTKETFLVRVIYNIAPPVANSRAETILENLFGEMLDIK